MTKIDMMLKVLCANHVVVVVVVGMAVVEVEAVVVVLVVVGMAVVEVKTVVVVIVAVEVVNVMVKVAELDVETNLCLF
ncbi:unnamed protein product [Prunus armeniaca]